MEGFCGEISSWGDCVVLKAWPDNVRSNIRPYWLLGSRKALVNAVTLVAGIETT